MYNIYIKKHIILNNRICMLTKTEIYNNNYRKILTEYKSNNELWNINKTYRVNMM